MGFAEINEWIYTVLTTIYLITILGTVIVVISENRNPVKTIAWVVVLLFLPLIGIIFYFFFGQDFTKHRMISKKSQKKLTQNFEEIDQNISLLALSGESKQIIRLCESTNKSMLYSGTSIRIFTVGAVLMDVLYNEIEKAKHHIHIQYYIFEDDATGMRIQNLLIKKALAGVEVRLIYDDVGCWDVKKKFFTEMAKHGIQVLPFLEVKFPVLANKINYRNHRKIVVIDGQIGFTGGMNIADRYVNGVKWGIWRDTHLMIQGQGVHGLQTSFSIDWYFASKQLISTINYFPAMPALGTSRMQTVMSGPIGEWRSIMLGIFKAIAGAKQSVYIQTPYFLPTEGLMIALQTAALSKVDVRLMLPARSDARIVHIGTLSFITSILKAGVKVYFYEPGFLHAKMMVIDDEFSTVGSANMDFRSFEHNFEINTFIYDKNIALEMKRIFINDQQNSKRITLHAWRKRPMMQKAQESIVRLLSPLL